MHKSYAFDFDKNIGLTQTPIVLEKRDGDNKEIVEVSQDDHYKLEDKKLIGPDKEYRLVDNDMEKSCINFRTTGDFTKQIKYILDTGAYGPSREKFEEANVSASPTGIITARGTTTKEIKDGHKMLIYEALQDDQIEELIENMRKHLGTKAPRKKDSLINKYLDNNYYAPCANEDFLGSIQASLQEPLHYRKTQAFEYFVQHVIRVYDSYYGEKNNEGIKICSGFSDDLTENVETMEVFVREIAYKYPDISFAMYDTADPQNIKKTTIQPK